MLFILQIINLSFTNNLFAQNFAVTSQPSDAKSTPIPQVWHKLMDKLADDGLSGADIRLAFLELNSTPSQSPMGNKIKELYSNKFSPKPKPTPTKRPAQQLYKNVITQANVDKCQDFLQIHKQAFDFMEKKYEVPREIAVALLFVETRLGTWLGKDLAFFMLASMAQSTEIQKISSWLPKLSGYQQHVSWINQTMTKRSAWAYKELYALLEYTRDNKIDPTILPSSIYGAIGICQFMPSNITTYGADGNGDGIINLFVAADAIASAANYLYKHGWRKNISRTKQHKVLKTYNRINIYANTILALNDSIIKANKLSTKK